MQHTLLGKYQGRSVIAYYTKNGLEVYFDTKENKCEYHVLTHTNHKKVARKIAISLFEIEQTNTNTHNVFTAVVEWLKNHNLYVGGTN